MDVVSTFIWNWLVNRWPLIHWATNESIWQFAYWKESSFSTENITKNGFINTYFIVTKNKQVRSFISDVFALFGAVSRYLASNMDGLVTLFLSIVLQFSLGKVDQNLKKERSLIYLLRWMQNIRDYRLDSKLLSVLSASIYAYAFKITHFTLYVCALRLFVVSSPSTCLSLHNHNFDWAFKHIKLLLWSR